MVGFWPKPTRSTPGTTCEIAVCVPRRRLAGCGGFVFHVMNRSAKQLALFDTPFEYEMFLKVLAEADRACPIRLLEYCVMPNHWHLLVWPERDDQLSRYMRWITGVHGQRWRKARGQPGKGAVYQGRYRWVGVQDGQHFDIARQYIRQNPVRAGWSTARTPGRGRVPVARRSRAGHCWRNAHGLSTRLIAGTIQPTTARSTPRLSTECEAVCGAGHAFGDAKWSRALEVRSWLTAVLEAHSKAHRAGHVENPSKTADLHPLVTRSGRRAVRIAAFWRPDPDRLAGPTPPIEAGSGCKRATTCRW